MLLKNLEEISEFMPANTCGLSYMVECKNARDLVKSHFGMLITITLHLFKIGLTSACSEVGKLQQ